MLSGEFKRRSFLFSDVRDHKGLLNRAINETENIYRDDKRRRYRDLKTIFNNVIQGLTLEYLLSENVDEFLLAPDRYHDILNRNTGDLIEVKAYNTTDPDSSYIKKEVDRLRSANWNRSKYMIVYSYVDGVYSYLTTIKL